MKRQFWLLTFLLALGTAAFGQQEPLFSQYMFNGLAYNPAYAGSKGHLSAALAYRTQWSDIEGSPQTQTLGLHLPSANLRHGFGLNLEHDQLAIYRQVGVAANYAFRLHLRKETWLALGLRGGIRSFRADYTQLNLRDPDDPNFAQDIQSTDPQLGAGLYIHSPKFFVGFSAPQILEPEWEDNGTTEASGYSRHYFFSAGGLIPVGRDIQFRPAMLVQYVRRAPASADIHAGFLFYEKFLAGLSYRVDNALALVVEWWPTDQLRIGYSYDHPVGRLNGIPGGSHEFMIGFDLISKKGNVRSPRYF